MIKKILILFAALVLLLVVIVALRPAEFRITRSTIVNAPAAVIFSHVNDFHKWEAWNPWQKVDPAIKNTYEGSPSGAGAVTTWAGNKDVGEGKMTIIVSQPSELIRVHMEFFKPFPSESTAEFTFKSEAKQTTVAWTMFGKSSFVARFFCLFMNMDKMVGGQFEKGLADLKTIAESARKK